ncbi:MAG: T9SS type A sorting domain-containing protein [Bernardetiaceae bacterium]|nr:T9SS type A sorting domain-containing protein [Bernardetiaceae bacterium]
MSKIIPLFFLLTISMLFPLASLKAQFAGGSGSGYASDMYERRLTGLSARQEINHNNHLQIFPNPNFSGILEVESITYFQDVEVFNSRGERVKYIKYLQKTKKTRVRISDLPNGLYILRLNTGESQKIIKA